MGRFSYQDRDYPFGQGMLTLRSIMGITQTELADLLGVSRRAVGAWEAGSKYPSVDNLKRFIAIAIQYKAFPEGREADEIRALWQAAHQKVLLNEGWLNTLLSGNNSVSKPSEDTSPRKRDGSRAVTNLPFQPTPFIGRETELAEISKLLSDPSCRLLTLLGPGGIGKTRLGIEVAAQQADAFGDGVVFVALASVNTPNQIVSAIGEALHLSFTGQSNPTSHLYGYLRERHMLLLLDNFEHLLEGADVVYDILQRAPDVTVLVTSRSRLNLQAEWLFDVEGLSYPTNGTTNADLTDYSAIALFLQQAIRVHQTFQVSQSTLPTIARICQQVAGMPLAIELAAASVRKLSVAEIEEQIRSNLDILATSLRDVPARHRSMRAVFDHSWNLLSQPEQVLFARLSVFRGGCTEDAAQQVTGASVAALTTLVHKSLVRQISVQSQFADTVSSRFVLLEPIREYALEKLNTLGENESPRQAHAAYYLRLAEAATAQWGTPTLDTWIGQLRREHDNLRMALQWASDSDNSLLGFQLTESLWKFWRSYGYIGEGRAWLDQLLALDENNPDPNVMKARRGALYAAAWLASDQHDYAHATSLFEQAMMLSRALGENTNETDLLLNAARQARTEGQYQQATMLLEEVLSRHRALDRNSLGGAELERSRSELGQVLRELGLILREQGQFNRARDLFEEGVQFHRSMGEHVSVALALLGLADVARDMGDASHVREYGQEGLSTFRELGMQWAIGFTLNTLAQADYIDGDFGHANSLISDSVSLFRSLQADASVAEVLITQGRILLGMGDILAAQDALTEAVRLAWRVGPRLMLVTALETLAIVIAHTHQYVLALQLLGAATTSRMQMGTPVRPADQLAVERAMATARTALGNDHFERLWSGVEHVPLEEILSLIPAFTEPSPSETKPVQEPAAEKIYVVQQSVQPVSNHRTDWDDAVTVPIFYGREWELNLLTDWIVSEHCRVISILGMGGMGKSTLAVTLMQQLAERFDIIIWRSLHDVLTTDVLLDDLIQVLAPRASGEAAMSFERRLSLLLEHMRRNRILLVLDNLESVMEEGENIGHLRQGFEGFGQFLRRSAETDHQSCVLLTSREKPNVLVPLEGSRAPVRTLRLARLDADSSEKLLAEKGVLGEPKDYVRLVEAYAGNPLALKIVAQTIVDLFDGEITPFLEQGEVIFGGIRELLNQQFTRVSALEQCVLMWLAIMRESVTLDELLTVMTIPITRARLLEVLESLRRRSLIERGNQHGSVILQSVVLEYITSRIIADISDAIQSGIPSRILIEHGLELAQAREYVREIQRRSIVAPILESLRGAYSQSPALEAQLLALLNELKTWDGAAQGYASANVVTLLRTLRNNLRGLDFSDLVLRGVYFQGAEMQDANLSNAFVQGSVFTETFDAVAHVDTSKTSDYWATGTRRGEIRLWTAAGLTLERVWRAHSDIISSLSFSPDGQALASTGSWDGTVKLWDIASGMLLWAGKHPSQAYYLAFAPDGSMLASTGYDAIVRLWDRQTGVQLQTLIHPDSVCGVAWSPDGRLVATGDLKGCIRLWEIKPTESAVCILTLNEHTNCVERLAFSPDGSMLASASWDYTVKVWDVQSGQVQYTLTEHTDRVIAVTWSPDGRLLASAGRDHNIWLWDVETKSYQATLQGHTATIYGIAFTPDSRNLVSGSDDSTLRVWDMMSGRCIRLLQGYAASVYDVDWSPDGAHLVSGGSDEMVRVYAVNNGALVKTLAGHHGYVIGVTWNANGRWFASGQWNNTIRLWDVSSEDSIRVLHFADATGDYFDRLAWSPDGALLAAGTYTHGIQIFDVVGRHQRGVGPQLSVWIRHVAWNPDGVRLAGGGADGAAYIWDTSADTLLMRLAGHHSTITDVAWSSDGRLLASTSRGSEGGEVFVWDVTTGELVHILKGHPTIVYAVAFASPDVLITADGEGTLRWCDLQREEVLRLVEAHQGTIHTLRPSPDKTKLASCGDDGAIMLWDLANGDYLKTIRRDRPYERLNITGIVGLTEAQKTTLRTLGAVEDGTINR